jgi:hypothetical protein
MNINEWVLAGRVLIDTESGKALGDLGIENAKAQHVLDKDTVLVHTTADGKSQLLQVKLKPEAVLAKRNEVRGIRKP